MSLYSEGDRYNRSKERLKRLRDRGIKLPWERKVETPPDPPDPSLDTRESSDGNEDS